MRNPPVRPRPAYSLVIVRPLPRLLDNDAEPLSGASLWRRWRLGMAVDGAAPSAWGLDGLERDDDLLPLRPDSLDNGAVRLLTSQYERTYGKDPALLLTAS